MTFEELHRALGHLAGGAPSRPPERRDRVPPAAAAGHARPSDRGHPHPKVLVVSVLVLAMAPVARYAETWQIHKAPSAPNVGG